MHQQSSFPNPLFRWLFSYCTAILSLLHGCISGFLIPFFPTTVELQTPWVLMVHRFTLSPLYFIATVMLLPPFLPVFILRCLLHLVRNPYCISFCENVPNDVSQPVKNGAYTNRGQSTFSVGTMNLCLLPEFLSRINNLNDTHKRAKEIGERVVIDQYFYRQMMQQPLSYSESRRYRNGEIGQKSPNNVGILPHFPNLDFICIQEAWCRQYSKTLLKELHKVYPWVVWDVGQMGLGVNYFGYNSGLMFASRYKILQLDFNYFRRSHGPCRMNSKGLLMAKVQISKDGEFPRRVGYVYSTHLQAFQGNTKISIHQLTDLLDWTTNFRKNTQVHGDVVLFDVLSGDFNCDNVSPADVECREHALFDVYTDPARVHPGRDHDWAIGTEMRNQFLHDSTISTPEGLARALSDPYLLQTYIIDGDLEQNTMDRIYNSKPKRDKDGNIILCRTGGRRRIDYILYRKDSCMAVDGYHFVSRLATLTDHIPVCMTFTCANP